MNFAKVSSGGGITVPAEIRRLLGLKPGDRILFLQNKNGEIVIDNASTRAVLTAQAAFDGAAERMNLSGEEDAQKLIDEVRHGSN